ncbi:MAG: SpoIID/LytB domain-containing protein [Cyanobium sp. LacPavin_0920_WC12_MAG_62_9]|nr:SpoIID/LytB domain-containing protein [Cyanobium sp. LacPavin_0920_WC12_MAG_62_9]
MGSLLVAGGCRAEPPGPQAPAQPQGSSRHWSVPLAPGVKPRDPVLWVALAAHLRPPEPLRLTSAQGNLTLITSTGRRISAPGLVLRWQMLPLAEPLQISRQVLGPFASFETAETAANSWRQQGAQAVVAHPGEWEVWAPLGSPLPTAGQPRLWQELQRQRPVLVLAPPPAAGGGAATANSVLEGPLQIDAPGGLRWKGGVYAGPFRLQGDAYGSWSLVEQVPLERYLLGVVPHEIGAGAPAAALEAQAVLARTWAVRNQGRFAVDGYHLCADTQCQVYGDPRGAGAAVKRAVVATQSRVLFQLALRRPGAALGCPTSSRPLMRPARGPRPSRGAFHCPWGRLGFTTSWPMAERPTGPTTPVFVGRAASMLARLPRLWRPRPPSWVNPNRWMCCDGVPVVGCWL